MIGHFRYFISMSFKSWELWLDTGALFSVNLSQVTAGFYPKKGKEMYL